MEALIKIQGDKGTVLTVPVKVIKQIGPFAIHRDYARPKQMVLSHLASGRRVRDVKDRRHGEQLALALIGIGANWGFDNEKELLDNMTVNQRAECQRIIIASVQGK